MTFIYNLNEKGFKKFEKDINEKIKEADYICITLETIESKLSVDLTKEKLKDFKVDVRYKEEGYSYIDFDLNINNIFLSNININEDLREILYYYDNYDSIEHLHEIRLNNGTIKFEYHNELDETIAKVNAED